MGNTYTKIVEISKEECGLKSLLGQVVTFWCIDFIWTGKLTAVNTDDVELEDPSLVFDTGPFNSKTWKDAQKLPNKIYIRLSSVSVYCVLK